jgi:hypothetical protein
LDNPEKFEIWLNYGCMANNCIRWKLKNNRRFSIYGLQSGYTIELTDSTGRNLYTSVTADNEHSITISGLKSGFIILCIEDRKSNTLKKNCISVSKQQQKRW